MGIHDSGIEGQLELIFDGCRESPEKIMLIKKAKQGDEKAWDELYAEYKDLLFGKYIQKILNYRLKKDNKEYDDAISNMHLLFVEAINEYDCKSSMFSTFLVNRIKWKFRDKLFSSRLIKAPVFTKTAKQTGEFHKKIDPQSLDIDNGSSKNKIKASSHGIKILNSGIETTIDAEMFVEKYIMPILEKNCKKKYIGIYKRYLHYMLEKKYSYKDIKTIAKKYDLTLRRTQDIITTINELLDKQFKKQGITITYEEK
jgi:hypothetical protein